MYPGIAEQSFLGQGVGRSNRPAPTTPSSFHIFTRTACVRSFVRVSGIIIRREELRCIMKHDHVTRRYIFYGTLLAGAVPLAGFGSEPR